MAFKKENIENLNDILGLTLVDISKETYVGTYRCDLFAKDETTEIKLIIENQLEDSNHDHLGKIITYASGKDAKTIIWIVKRARDEHRQAIEWLNAHTDEEVGLFLLEIELWKIGYSIPAPKFNIVSKPNDWGKTQKASNGLGKAQKLQGEFWQAFGEYGASNEDFSKEFNKRKALPQHWYDLPMGSSEYHISLTCATQRSEIGIEVYIDNNKDIYDLFYKNREIIEEKTGLKYKWQRLDDKKASRIKAIKKCDVNNQEEWEEGFKWFCENALKIKEEFNKVFNK